MNEQEFTQFYEQGILSYAEENVTAGRCKQEDAVEQSRLENERLLPQGRLTPDHDFYNIYCPNKKAIVGYLWTMVETKFNQRTAFVYDVKIKENYRRQGYGQVAFRALEKIAKQQGIQRIGRHVFGHNPGAQALYKKLGYGVTGINMAKDLSD